MVEITKIEYLCKCNNIIFKKKNQYVRKFRGWKNLKMYCIEKNRMNNLNIYLKKCLSDYNVQFYTINCKKCDAKLGSDNKSLINLCREILIK